MLEEYCSEIVFPGPSTTEDEGLQNLKAHLLSSYPKHTYIEIQQLHPSSAKHLYYKYYSGKHTHTETISTCLAYHFLYTFLFLSVLCPQTKRTISIATAIHAWDALNMSTVFSNYENWKQFLTSEKSKGGISKVREDETNVCANVW